MAKTSVKPDLEETAGRLHAAAIQLLRGLRPVDEEAGISAAQLSALSVLVFAGPRGLGDLAAAEQVTAASMSRLVTGMEQDGLVRRSTDPRDGRGVIVQPTRRGRRILERGRARRIAHVVGRLSALSSRDLRLLARVMDALERVARG